MPRPPKAPLARHALRRAALQFSASKTPSSFDSALSHLREQVHNVSAKSDSTTNVVLNSASSSVARHRVRESMATYLDAQSSPRARRDVSRGCSTAAGRLVASRILMEMRGTFASWAETHHSAADALRKSAATSTDGCAVLSKSSTADDLFGEYTPEASTNGKKITQTVDDL